MLWPWEWAPGLPTPHRAGRHPAPVVMAHRNPADFTLPPGRMIPAALVVPAAPAAPAGPVVLAVLAVLAGPIIPVVPEARVGPAGPVPITRAARADPGAQVPITPADPVGPAARVDPAVPVVPVVRGMAMTSGATSTAPRGATGLARGAPARRRDRRGIGRSPRLAVHGVMARSTTGATRKRRTGTPVSTSGDSTSSGSGFRCKDR